MKTIELFAQVHTASGQPCQGLAVVLESFALATAVWQPVGQASTDAQGQLHLKLALPTAGAAHAPLVRLVLAGEPADRVLATGGRVVYAPRTGLLTVDMGAVTLLDEHAAAPASTQRRLKGVGLRLAGVATPAIAVAKPAGLVGVPIKPIGTLIDPVVVAPVAPAVTAPVAAAGTLTTIDPAVLQNLQNLQTVNAAQQLQLRQLTDQTVALQTTVDLVTQRANAADAQVETLRLNLASLQDQNLATTKTLQLTQSDAASLREQVASLALENKGLKDALAQPAVGVATTPRVANLQSLTSDLHTQFNSASLNLIQSGAGMQLGDVRIRVRGKIGADGSFQLPGVDELAKPGVSEGLDEIDVSLGGAPGTAAADPTVNVPDLNRLTESAARQVLQSLGLRLDIATGLREEGYASGQAMRQQPRATLKAPRGSQVLVVFAQ